MLSITTIPVTVFAQNARIVACTTTKECVIVDPGGDADEIVKQVSKLGLSCKAIWLTHSHLDHCAGVAPLLEHYKVPLFGHKNEAQMRATVSTIAMMYGLPPAEWPNCPEPTDFLSGGETVRVGECAAKVLFTPGHSPGSVSFYFESDGVLLGGDVLFQGSIGRTDLPGGDHNQLIATIRRELFVLPDDTRVLSGHGEDTTIGIERFSNPYCAERA
jgi:glyoxylase-like metal-dependent hydrolase (beta-lactamase superfamily II)